MKVLMLGGTGFIGTYVSRQLLAEGHHLTIFHRGETNPSLSQPVPEIFGDRQQLVSHRDTFRQLSPDVVIDMIPATEDEGRQLVEAFRGGSQRLVVISSADVYRNYELVRRVEDDEPDSRLLSEDAPVRRNLFPYRSTAKDPTDRLYNYDKILVEAAVMGNSDIPSTVLRLPAVYGPGDAKRRLFHYVKRMDDGRPAIIVEQGMMNWRWTRGYVENVAAAICFVAGDQNSVGRIYNVGEIRGLTESEWISSIAREAGWKGRIVPVEPLDLPEQMRSNLSWQHHLETDTSQIRKLTGFFEPIAFDEGLRRTVHWERMNPPADSKPEDFDYATEDAVLAKIGMN